MRLFYPHFLILISALSCTPNPPSKGNKSKQSISTSTANTSSTTDSDTAVSTQTEFALTIDPRTASGNIDSKIAMAPSDILNDPNVVFPQLTLNKTTADYIQIIRCAASYDMLTLQGQSIRKTLKTLSYDDKKWGWSQAISDYHNCKIVSNYLIAPTYVDMPAPSGSFYYVANPCVSAASSSTGQEGCSYDLSFTEPFLNYQNALIDKLREKSIELATVQAALYAKLDDVRITAKKFEVALHLCEEFYAFKENEKAIQRGLIMLGLTIAGAIVGAGIGSFIPFLGVAGGAMIVGMIAQMAGSSIINEILNINPRVSSCLKGEAGVADEGLTKQKEIERSRVAARFYESKFNVKATIDHLTELLQVADKDHPTGGLIAQDITRMQNIMTEMNEIDQKVISVNTFIANANKVVAEQAAEMDKINP